MTALSKDIQVLRVGAEGPAAIAAPLKALSTVYSGSIALLDSSGRIVNSATPTSAMTCMGIIGNPAGGTYVKTGPGIVGGTTDTSVYVDCLTGTFLLASGTGADALTELNANTTVYVIDEQSVGATNGSNTRPAAGVMLPITPDMPTGFVAVKMVNPAG